MNKICNSLHWKEVRFKLPSSEYYEKHNKQWSIFSQKKSQSNEPIFSCWWKYYLPDVSGHNHINTKDWKICTYLIECFQHTFSTDDNWDCKWRTYSWASGDISPTPWPSTFSDGSTWIFSVLDDSWSFEDDLITLALSSNIPCSSDSELSILCFSRFSSKASRFFSRQSLYSAFRKVYLQ